MKNQQSSAPPPSGASQPNSFYLLEAAVLTLQDGIAVLSHDGKVEYINAAAQMICSRSYGAPPVTGCYFFDFIRDENQSRRARASFDKAISNQKSERKVQFSIEGKEYWFRMGYHPMPDEKGRVTHVCATAKDITAEVLLERRLTLQRQTQKNEVIKAALDAQEKERSFIGRELHDNVNQVLTTVRLYVDLNLQKEQVDREILQKTLQHIDYCIREIRSLSHRLDPSDGLEDTREPLYESLGRLVQSINNTGKLNINFFYHGMDKLRLDQEMQIGIYRVVQELLTNILKHAGATMVDFFIVGTSKNLSLRISDNGNGFDIGLAKIGSGIRGIRQRVQDMKGDLQFNTSVGEGCTVNLRIPLQ